MKHMGHGEGIGIILENKNQQILVPVLVYGHCTCEWTVSSVMWGNESTVVTSI
jgi:hypothetical protein